jgi:ADP-dependent NAD(P)H-hydrate dehydratase / NAD(P)H-hydrate epimerase
MRISTVSEMRRMDQTAIQDYAIPELILMENAGLAVCDVVARYDGVEGKRFCVVCGGGNNGGDGLVIARHLHTRGAQVSVRLLSDPAKFGDAARANWQMVQRLPLNTERLTEGARLAPALEECDAIIDALLGTGLARGVEGVYAEAIRLINKSGKPIFAVDIASGVNGDTGQVMGHAVKATATITFGLPKAGNMLYPGYEQGGALWVSHIGFPPALFDDPQLAMAVNKPVELPPRPQDGHKGTFGQALFVAGAASYYGAPYFAAMAFMKAGGGYSRLATPRSVAPVLAAKGSELVYLPQDETEEGSIALANAERLFAVARKMDFVVIGPGLSLAEETQELVRQLCAGVEGTLLLDGDGLTAVQADLDVVRQRNSPTVLTPHLGEMSRLIDVKVSDIKADQVEVLRRAATELNSIIVLKGAHTMIGYPDGRIYVNLSSNSGMASAGSGDVLTGTIAAMVGLGLPVETAVRQGVYLHGVAGDLAADRIGQDGITAEDILEGLPEALRQHRCQGMRLWHARYALPLVSGEATGTTRQRDPHDAERT